MQDECPRPARGPPIAEFKVRHIKGLFQFGRDIDPAHVDPFRA